MLRVTLTSLVVTLFSICPSGIFAQNVVPDHGSSLQEGQSTSSTPDEFRTMTWPRGGITSPGMISEDFHPNLQVLEMPHPSGRERRKREALSARTTGANDTLTILGLAQAPVVNQSFSGNLWDFRTPNDNHLAISNDGKLVSVINSLIYMYDTEPTIRIRKSVSLAAFSQPLGYTESKYDPRVLYDPDADRFIVVYLNGSLDTTSRIIIAFSKTNDPLNDWYLYALDGNPINNQTWSDFPTVGLSSGELFITFNTFLNGSMNNSGFVESTIWQINKQDGFQGDSLRTRYYTGMAHQGKSYFNITPLQGGDGLYGPDMYFISNRNLSPGSDTFFLFHINGLIQTNPTPTVQVLQSDIAYGVPPGAHQPNGDTLDTNDARILSGFYQNGQIQVVGNTEVGRTGLAGIYHGTIPDAGNPSIKLNIIGDTVLDLGYPSIAYAGVVPGDFNSLITVNFSGPGTNSGYAALYYDKLGYYSWLHEVKSGETPVDILIGTMERWGDYSGIQRKYNNPGTAWAAGSYGRNNVHHTWISKLVSPELTGIENPGSPRVDAVVFPNPVTDHLQVRFTMVESARLTIALYSLDGRRMHVLLADAIKPGTHLFSCSVDPLPPGIYFLTASDPNGLAVFTRKVVKQ